MVDVTFTNINRLFVLSFKNGNDDQTRSVWRDDRNDQKW